MKSYNFADANLKLVGEGCRTLSAFRGEDSEGNPFIVTGWQPTVDDIISLMQAGPIHIMTMGTSFNPIRVYTTNVATNQVNPEFIDEPEVKSDIQKIKDYFLMLNSIPKPAIEDKSLKMKMDNFFMQMFPLANKTTEIFMKAEEEMNQDAAIKDLITDAVYQDEDGAKYNHLHLRRVYEKDAVDDMLKLQVDEVYRFESGSSITRIK